MNDKVKTCLFSLPCRDKDQPIWVSLSRERTEMYREIIDLEYGHSVELEE